MLPAQYIIFMFLGVAFNYLYCHKIAPDQGYFIIGFLFFLFCTVWWIGPYSESLILAWSYALALLTFMFAYTFPYFFKANSLSLFLANISYPLYIIHCIPGYVFLRILLDKRFSPGISLVMVSTVIMIFSWFLHRFIEQPFQRLGKKLAIEFNLISNLFIKRMKPLNLDQSS